MKLSTALSDNLPPESIVPAEVLSTLRTPKGYRLSSTGILRVTPRTRTARGYTTRLTSAPMLIVRRVTDILTGEASRQVVWYGPDGWTSRIVARDDLLRPAGLMSLVKYDAPITSLNSKRLVTYFAAMEAKNMEALPSLDCASRMGWLPDGSFLLPDLHFAPDDRPRDILLTPKGNRAKLATAWTPRGSWPAWLSTVEKVLDYPYMMIALYASAAAPILKILRLPGFIVDFSGETTGGKTTALRLAASVWGKPTDDYPTTLYSWDVSIPWVESAAGFLHSLPLILDDTKRARQKKVISDVIYAFCQGQGRGRATGDVPTWHSVLISSGEGAAPSYSNDAGTRARVLNLSGKPLGGHPQEGAKLSEDIQYALSSNYGHLGRRVIEYLVSNRENHEQLRKLFELAREEYASIAQSAVGRRHSAHLACLEVAASIVHQLGIPRPERDPFADLVKAAADAGNDADLPLAALYEVVSWTLTNQDHFWGRHDPACVSKYLPPKAPPTGWAGAWSPKDNWTFIGYTRSRLTELLDSFGHHADEVITAWNNRGWFDNAGRKQTSRVKRVGDHNLRCLCLTREMVELIANEMQ